MLARLWGRDDVHDALARRTTSACVQVAGSWYSAVLFTVVDFSAVTIGALRPQVGACPPGDGTFIIERSSLDFSGATVGEEVRFSWGKSPPVSLPLRGVVRDVGLAPAWMEHVVYGFIPWTSAVRNGPHRESAQLKIVVAEHELDEGHIHEVADRVKALIGCAASHGSMTPSSTGSSASVGHRTASNCAVHWTIARPTLWSSISTFR